MSAETIAIHAKDVTKSYASTNVKALDQVSFSINEGEFVSIVGTSGSGKTTMLNIISGLDADFSGDVEIFGCAIRQLSDAALAQFRNQRIGFVFQQFNLLEHVSCLENVLLPLVFYRGAPVQDARQRAERILERVGLSDRKNTLASRLSGGQKQRVAIARALFNEPAILLCDEPTGNLDRTTGHQIIELFRKLNREDRRTLVIVTHEDRVSAVADRQIRFEDGRIVADTRQDPASLRVST